MMKIQIPQSLFLTIPQEIRIDFRFTEFQKEKTAKIYENNFDLSVYKNFESSLQGTDTFDVTTIKQIHSSGRWIKEKEITAKDYSEVIRLMVLPIVILIDSTSGRAFVMDGQHRIQAYYEEAIKNVAQEKIVRFVVFEVINGFRYLPCNYKKIG